MERCKVRVLLKTADCGEIYSKINGELEFNVGYYSKQGEEDKVNEGDEEMFSKDLRIKNYDSYRRAGSVFKKAEQDGIEVNYKNKSIFK